MASEAALLPCPFCAGAAHIERYGDHRTSTIYQCDWCGCMLETGEEFNHGAQWNQRYVIDAAAAVDGDAQWDVESIYVASKTRHANMWRRYRDDGVQIISTWIDEAGDGESACLADLWRRCIEESSRASVLVIYCAEGDVLKGAWVELGAALASGKPVFAVGIEQFTVANHTSIKHCATVDDAFVAIRSLKRG